MVAPPLVSILQHFPPVDFAIAYGSGVFKQSNHNSSNSMIDLVLAVEDPLQWHSVQLMQHPEHYSSLRYLGPAAIVYVQEQLGAGVYYNTLAPIPGSKQMSMHGQKRYFFDIYVWFPKYGLFLSTNVCLLVKYGVVRTSTLYSDLRDWNTLYLSGRMHKPVQ